MIFSRLICNLNDNIPALGMHDIFLDRGFNQQSITNGYGAWTLFANVPSPK